MDYFDKYYKNEKTLKELIEEYTDCLERVQYYGDLLRNKALDTPGAMQEAKLELGGIFTSINSVYMSLSAERRNREDLLAEEKRQYKMSGIEMPMLEKIRFIGYLRKMEFIFAAKCESCSKVITILQSTLKSFDKEKTVPYD